MHFIDLLCIKKIPRVHISKKQQQQGGKARDCVLTCKKNSGIRLLEYTFLRANNIGDKETVCCTVYVLEMSISYKN